MRNHYEDFMDRDPDLWLMRRLWEDKFNEDTILFGMDFCGDWREVDKLMEYSATIKI